MTRREQEKLALLGLLADMSAADGEVTKGETDLLLKTCILCDIDFGDMKKVPKSIMECLSILREASPVFKETVKTGLLAMMVADGEVHAEEAKLFKLAEMFIGF